MEPKTSIHKLLLTTGENTVTLGVKCNATAFLFRKGISMKRNRFLDKTRGERGNLPDNHISRLSSAYIYLRRNWPYVFCIIMCIFLISGTIFMILFERALEIDTGLKYLAYPLDSLALASFGRYIVFWREKKIILRETDSRWAEDAEIKRGCSLIDTETGEAQGAGIPIIIEGSKVYVDNSESHTLIIGSTGSGKTRKIILPQIHCLRLRKESIIVSDPKGELFQLTSGVFHNSGYKVVKLDFRDPLDGDAWNPLTMPYRYYKGGNPDKAMEMLNDIATNIMVEKKNQNDPFWERSSVDYFIGLARGLFEDAKEEAEVNLNSIMRMSFSGQDKNGISTFIKDYINLKGEDSAVYTCAAGTVNAPNDTKASVLSVFHQKMRLYTSQENLSKMLSFSSFNIRDIGTTPTIVYMIIQDEKSTYHPLASTFIKQCYEVLVDVATANGGKLERRTNVILDEFGNLPPIIDMKSIVSAARSRNIRLTLAIQSHKQLESVYAEAEADVIKNNCNNYVYLYGRDLHTLKEISELCGQREEQIDVNQFEQKPLISTSQLQRLKDGEAIMLTRENFPYKAFLPDISQYNFPAAVPYSIEILEHPEVATFDLKGLVKVEKRRRTMEAIQKAQEESSATERQPVDEKSSPDESVEDKPIDIDELVRNIDKQIAELEAEQKAEESAKKQDAQVVENPPTENTAPM